MTLMKKESLLLGMIDKLEDKLVVLEFCSQNLSLIDKDAEKEDLQKQLRTAHNALVKVRKEVLNLG